jgi:protein SCO1/2
VSVGSRAILAWAVLALAAHACKPRPEGRRFPLTGQVLAVHAERDEVLLRHDDVPGFMPAMVMAFPVAEPRRLQGLGAGDLVKAVLVVGESGVRLEDLQETGSRPLPPEASAAQAEELAPGSPVPDVRLRDSEGRERRLSSLRGRAVALTFIFTRCPLPEFCPALDKRFAELQQRVRADATLRGSVVLLSISFDPEYDTPEVLRRHAQALRADPGTWIFATGDAAEIGAFAAGFGLAVSRDGGITHNLRTAVVDASGRLVKVYRGADWTPDQLASDLGPARSGS